MTRLNAFALGVSGLLCSIAAAAAAERVGPLESYVRRTDESYGWVKRREGSVQGCQFVELTLTSQTWHDIVWKHQLFILKPPNVAHPQQAILMIGAGRWRDELAQANAKSGDVPREVLMLALAARQVHSPVAVLMQVPQQPIFGGKVEDQIISYTFEQFLRTHDDSWPLLLPMVKSAVRGMDAVQEFARDQWKLDIEHFTLTGASKRGWTTWLTGAVDERVNAIAPMVIDVLNMGPQMAHQLATWGSFSEQLHDYTARGIQRHMFGGGGQQLRAIVDPYSYRQRLTQPKLVLLGTNDRYWPLDSLNLYWDGLEGEKHVLYVPNNGHGLRDVDRIVGTISALHRQAAGGPKLAKLKWDLKSSADALQLNVRSDVKPKKVVAWVATAATRDFRDAIWSSYATKAAGDNNEFRQKLSPDAFTAVFGEAVYETDQMPYFLSTTLKIAPPKPATVKGKTAATTGIQQ